MANRPDGGMAAIPCDLFLWPTTRSYTRQPSAEFHTIGSPPILEAILQSLYRAGARLAQPGEFTFRAFLAGRIDLTQAEAVLGIVQAQDIQHLDVALRQLAGGLSKPLGGLRDDLLQLLAELEAGLDFSEEDIEFIAPDAAVGQLTHAAQLVATTAKQLQARNTTHAAFRVVLAGHPNAGKSSLFNAMAKRYAALPPTNDPDPIAKSLVPAMVAAQPGTTRDYLTVRLDLDGVLCELVDTAGTEPDFPIAAPTRNPGIGILPTKPFAQNGSPSPSGQEVLSSPDSRTKLNAPHSSAGASQEIPPDIEHAAGMLAIQQQNQADLALVCIPADDLSRWVMDSEGEFMAPAERIDRNESQQSADPSNPIHETDILAASPSIANPIGPRCLAICTKGDLLPAAVPVHPREHPNPMIMTSTRTGDGICALGAMIRQIALAAPMPSGAAVAATAARCRESLFEAAGALDRAADLAIARQGDELVAAEVRLAANSLGSVVGAVYTDDLLDRIFRSFCIGK